MSQPEDAPVLLLTVPEAARRLGLKSRSTVYEMVHAGELAATEGRGGLRIPESALAEYVADRTVKALPRTPKPVRPRARPPTIVGGGQDVMARKTVRSTRKRARKGEGTVFYDDSRGCYVGQIDLGLDPVTGKRRRPKVSGATEEEVRDLLDDLKSERKSTGTVAPRNVTVRTVVEAWLANPPRDVKSADSRRVHRDAAKRVCDGARGVPGIGSKALIGGKALNVDDVETQLRRFAEAGYAAKTIQQTRSVLLRSIKRAQRDIKSLRNVAELAELPGDAPTRTSKSLARNEVDALLALKLTPWWRAYITVATHLGLRPGELLGLRWEDVDLDKGLMQVRYALRRSRVDGKYVRALVELKTDRSKRDLDMPAAVRRELTALRKFQIAERLRLGPRWTGAVGLENCGPDGLVFCGKYGRPQDRESVRVAFRTLCDHAGLGEDWQLRETRHTAVSLLSDHGVPAERISDVMGHVDPTVTMRVYRHQLRPTVADAAQAMDEIFKPSATHRAKPNTP